MKKIIITETQLRMLLKENESENQDTEYFNFEVDMHYFGLRYGMFSVTLFDKDDTEYDYEKAHIFEIDFSWSESGGELDDYQPTEIRMVYPEEKEMDLSFFDFFMSDDKMNKEINNQIDRAMSKFIKNYNPY